MQKQLPNILFAGGALCIMASTIIFMSGQTAIAPYILITGVAALVVFHYITATQNSLRRYFLPVLFFLGAIFFMFREQNSWILMLFIASILELYYAFRTKD